MRIAEWEDRQLVAEILRSAFVSEKSANSINFIVKQDQHRAARIQLLMRYLFELAYFKGKVFISENNKACLLVLFPDKKPGWKKIRLWAWQPILALRCIGIRRLYKVWKRKKTLEKFQLKEPHIYPLIMGVHHDIRGRGSALRLVLKVMKAHGKTRYPVVLETTTAENIKLYRSFGFEVFEQTEDLGYTLSFLKRPAGL